MQLSRSLSMRPSHSHHLFFRWFHTFYHHRLIARKVSRLRFIVLPFSRKNCSRRKGAKKKVRKAKSLNLCTFSSLRKLFLALQHFPGHFFSTNPSLLQKTKLHFCLRSRTRKSFHTLALLILSTHENEFLNSIVPEAKPKFASQFLFSLKRKWNRFFAIRKNFL